MPSYHTSSLAMKNLAALEQRIIAAELGREHRPDFDKWLKDLPLSTRRIGMSRNFASAYGPDTGRHPVWKAIIMTNEIQRTKDWFKEAVPTPLPKNFQVQTGVHLEEVSEMLDAMIGSDNASEAALNQLKNAITNMATGLKTGTFNVTVTNRRELLDGLTDQVVTAVGIGHMVFLDIPKALSRVNDSNWSKFVDGHAVFDANGKIAKGQGFFKPQLDDLI